MKDTEKVLNCPACGKEMKKVWFENRGFFVDICTDGCGGVWLDNRELDKIDERFENADAILEELEGKVFAEVDRTKDRFCPVCGAKMVKCNYTDDSTPVKIDACYSCGGKFLDNDELRAIRQTFQDEPDMVDDALTVRKYTPKGHSGVVVLFQAITNKVLPHFKYDE